MPLKIVCFGDSLTLGYLSPTHNSPFPESIPYGTYLQEWLRSRGTVFVHAVCGETTQDMRRRFDRDVLGYCPDAVIILGGTNDLGVGMSLDSILENLRFFYGQAQGHKILPIAVTVPSVRDLEWPMNAEMETVSSFGLSPAIEQAILLRVTLNQIIKDYCGEKGFPVVDWFTETCEPQTQALAAEYSNDGLHLTTAGYYTLAKMIWHDVLKGLVNSSRL